MARQPEGAACRVFIARLAPLREAGVEVEVWVGPDPVHGTLARIVLKAAPGSDRAAIERRVGELLAPFVIRHTLDWS